MRIVAEVTEREGGKLRANNVGIRKEGERQERERREGRIQKMKDRWRNREGRRERKGRKGGREKVGKEGGRS